MSARPAAECLPSSRSGPVSLALSSLSSSHSAHRASGHTPIPWFPQAGFCRATASCGFLDATRGPGTEKHLLLWVLCGLPYPSVSREAAARLPDAAQKLHSTPRLRPACIIPLPSVLSSLIIPRRVSAEQQNILRVRDTTFTRRTGNGSNRAI